MKKLFTHESIITLLRHARCDVPCLEFRGTPSTTLLTALFCVLCVLLWLYVVTFNNSR